jgi:hypothetical protein
MMFNCPKVRDMCRRHPKLTAKVLSTATNRNTKYWLSRTKVGSCDVLTPLLEVCIKRGKGL